MSGATLAPAGFGRGVLVAPGAEPPAPWREAGRVRIDAATLADATDLVSRLHRGWSEREPLVVELATDPAAFRDPQSVTAAPWSLNPRLELPLDRLHHLVWANNYDARSGEPIWWWTKKAERCGAGADGEADVRLPGGESAWIDGGPRWNIPSGPNAVVHSGAVELGKLAPAPRKVSAPSADLAPDQLAAVAVAGGPVRVIAPAGSGKTRVLTERMRHLLADHAYQPETTIAVAYNKEAQRELEARLFRLDPRTRTLNSLGYGIVGTHRGARPPLIAEMEIRRICEEVFPIPRRRANTDPVGPFIDALGAVRLGLRDPELVEAERDDVSGFAAGFDRYRAKLAARGGVDFDEQIYGALEALLADGSFRRRMQRSHRHMLVDEFQDLTPAHLLLIRLLAMPAFDVFGVGDDDQTIYDHAGADPRFLVDFADYFPGADTRALEVNYRCAVPIVEGAKTLLSYNRVRVEKEIRPASGAGREPQSLELRTHASEAAAETVVELIRSWRSDDDLDASQIAILARVNSLLLVPQIALWGAGVPLKAPIGPEICERTGMAAALAWLRVAVDPEGLVPADLDLIRRRPSRGFPNWISKWFANCRTVGDLRAIERRIDDERVAGKVGEMADDIELLAKLAREGATARGLLEAVRDRIGLGSAMQMLDGSKGTQATASHLDDLEALIGVSDMHPDPHTFEPWLRASLVESAGSEGVTLSTVHRVKGREWERVAVFGVIDGIVPHRLSDDWEAERRVLHVAITRASDRCVVLADAERRSRFLDELSGQAELPAVAPPAPTKRSKGGGSAAKPPIDLDAAKPESAVAAEALRAWRRERSTEDSVPAYVVLSNRQLDGVAAAMPANSKELVACEGIGPSRLERYGDEILAVLDSVRG